MVLYVGVLHTLSFQQNEGINQEREKGRGTETGDPTGEKSKGNPKMMILKGYWRMTTVEDHARRTTSPDLSRSEGSGRQFFRKMKFIKYLM